MLGQLLDLWFLGLVIERALTYTRDWQCLSRIDAVHVSVRIGVGW
jgi:hypothetical protein